MLHTESTIASRSLHIVRKAMDFDREIVWVGIYTQKEKVEGFQWSFI